MNIMSHTAGLTFVSRSLASALWWRWEVKRRDRLGRQSNYYDMNYVHGFSLKSW